MIRTLIVLIVCTVALPATEVEPLIPHDVNLIIPRIRPGMSVSEVEMVMKPVFPDVKGLMDMWSGQTGYISYRLNERYSLKVSSIARDGKEVVHDRILVYLHDRAAGRRVDISVRELGTQESKKTEKQK